MGENGLGYKYYDGESISAISMYNKLDNDSQLAVYWVNPKGARILEIIANHAKRILQEFGIHTYVKKIDEVTYKQLLDLGFKSTGENPWLREIHSEDDTYPEAILEVKNTFSVAERLGNTRQLKRALKIFKSYLKNDEIEIKDVSENKEDAWFIVNKFFKERYSNISSPNDYFNLIFREYDESVIRKVLYYKNQPAGFFFVKIQNPIYASLYASITLRAITNSISDFLYFSVLARLRKMGVKYLNLGGSEIISLKEYKDKFKPIKYIQHYWATFF
jgi:hypothetical protein